MRSFSKKFAASQIVVKQLCGSHLRLLTLILYQAVASSKISSIFQVHHKLALTVTCRAAQEITVDAKYHARTGINSRADYERMYKRSIQDPAGFWQEQAQAFTWQKKVCDLILCGFLKWPVAFGADKGQALDGTCESML